MLIRIYQKADTFEINGNEAEIASKLLNTKLKDPANPCLFLSKQTIPGAIEVLVAHNYSLKFFIQTDGQWVVDRSVIYP